MFANHDTYTDFREVIYELGLIVCRSVFFSLFFSSLPRFFRFSMRTTSDGEPLFLEIFCCLDNELETLRYIVRYQKLRSIDEHWDVMFLRAIPLSSFTHFPGKVVCMFPSLRPSPIVCLVVRCVYWITNRKKTLSSSRTDFKITFIVCPRYINMFGMGIRTLIRGVFFFFLYPLSQLLLSITL